MKRYLFVVLAALVLTGCPSRTPVAPTTPPVTIEPVTPPVIETPPPVDTVPQPPKVQSIDWAISVEPLVAKMVNNNEVANGSILLLDSVKNNTNGALQTAKATAALHQVLASNKKFVLISPQQLEIGRAHV